MTDMETFSDRLRYLIGSKSVSAFARQVGMSESLLRKYLNGSEPSLSRANQIAMAGNCSLEWLATGQGYLYRKAEVVDMEALNLAKDMLARHCLASQIQLSNDVVLKITVAVYQYLRATKRTDQSFDLAAAQGFVEYSLSLCE